MKRWLLLALAAAGFGLAIANSNYAQATDKIAMFLETESKSRTSKLQLTLIEGDLHSKLQRLQTFSHKAQSLAQDRQLRCYNEERSKLVTRRIQAAVKKVAADDDIDLVVDASAVAFNSRDRR